LGGFWEIFMAVNSIDDLIKDFWENRAVGIEAEPLSMINKRSIAYLRERYPYVQVISVNAKFEEAVIPKFKRATSGWIIHDYGQAMSSSPGRYLYGPGNPEVAWRESEDGEGSGTLTRQTVDTAKAMIALAIEKGWPGMEIIAGSDLMQWAIYLAALDKNYPLTGYSPDAEGTKRLERVQRIRKQQTSEAEPGLGKKG
jgi:hypothetical protein